MLLFIKYRWSKIQGPQGFQYISCYCLSIIWWVWPCMQTNFNTSHVTVYPNSCSKSNQSIQFQYISCYCLSGTDTREFQGNVKFQYISCYCLSAIQQLKESKKLYFNTSYVTVYPMALEVSNCSFRFQYISCYCLSFPEVVSGPLMYDFNTSHVTVYPGSLP